MARLYKRGYAITFARLVKGQFFPTNGTAATKITDLHAQFSIERQHRFSDGETSHPQPNTCRISIWNLASATRAALEYKPTYVRLEAGYDDNVRLLFEGDILFATSKREGVDWITELQLTDGGRAYREARVNRSYKAGIQAREALRDICTAMGVKPPRASELGELAAQYVSGLTLYGNAARELTRVLAPHGLSWSIQNGRLQILRDTDARSEAAITVSQDAGMISSPEFGAPDKPGKRPILSGKMLLHPGILPGGLIKVQSLTANGLYRVDRVTHECSSWTGDFMTSFEARQKQ